MLNWICDATFSSVAMRSLSAVILVRLALAIYPNKPTEENPLFKFSFHDTASLISRMKSIKFTPYWQIEQLGNNIKIELSHE